MGGVEKTARGLEPTTVGSSMITILYSRRALASSSGDTLPRTAEANTAWLDQRPGEL